MQGLESDIYSPRFQTGSANFLYQHDSVLYGDGQRHRCIGRSNQSIQPNFLLGLVERRNYLRIPGQVVPDNKHEHGRPDTQS